LVILHFLVLDLLVKLGQLFHQQPHYLLTEVVSRSFQLYVLVFTVLPVNFVVLLLHFLEDLPALLHQVAEPLLYFR
jgi:hypothetical protein